MINKLIILLLSLMLFISKANANENPLKCSWVPEVKNQIKSLHEKLTSSSTRYITYNASSEGWVIEMYIFIGKIGSEYKIISVSTQSDKQEKTISEEEFKDILENAKKAVFDNEIKAGESSHKHCTQFILKTSAQRQEKTLEGLLPEFKVRSFENRLQSFIKFKNES